MSKSPENYTNNSKLTIAGDSIGSRLSDRFDLGAELESDGPTMIGAVLRAADRNFANFEDMRLRAEEAEDESRHDHLTGLLNRKGLEHYLGAWANKEGAPMETKIVFIAVDINNLKFTNDTYGYEEGDKLIVSVAGELVEIANIGRREDDPAALARMGEKADEFLLVLPARDIVAAAHLDGGDPSDFVRQSVGKLINEKNKNRTYAVGYCVSTRGEILSESGFEVAKNIAERAMKRNKIKMKLGDDKTFEI